MKNLNLMKNIILGVAGVVTFAIQFAAEDYAASHRLNPFAIGGELFVGLVVFSILYAIITAIFRNLEERQVASETDKATAVTKRSSCITATATINTKGICRVVDTAGKKKTYKNLGEYVKTL